jgi:hypothetical protein
MLGKEAGCEQFLLPADRQELPSPIIGHELRGGIWNNLSEEKEKLKRKRKVERTV